MFTIVCRIGARPGAGGGYPARSFPEAVPGSPRSLREESARVDLSGSAQSGVEQPAAADTRLPVRGRTGSRESVADAVALRLYEKALKQLPLTETAILSYHIYGEMKFREIAELMGLPLGTVLWRYRRAIRAAAGVF